MTEQLQGEVAWYNSHKGYGLIKGDDGVEYFIHHTNLTLEQKQLFTQERVSFLAKPRSQGKGYEAYEVTILPVEVDENANDFVSIMKRINLSFRENVERKAQYTFWEQGSDKYPEFQEQIEHIKEKFDLDIIPVDEKIVRKAFLPQNDMPAGALTRYNDTSDWQKRRGVYVCMRDSDVTLIVHAFYDNPERLISCWRAKVFRHKDGKIFPMKKSWRERFDYFISDIQYLMRGSRRGQRQKVS